MMFFFENKYGPLHKNGNCYPKSIFWATEPLCVGKANLLTSRNADEFRVGDLAAYDKQGYAVKYSSEHPTPIGVCIKEKDEQGYVTIQLNYKIEYK